jgi:hypothetical protein
MSTHLALSAPPVSAVRTIQLGATGLQGRRVRRGSDFRSQIRALLLSPAGRHRVTFIPLDRFASEAD